jgi:hypothetical protein
VSHVRQARDHHSKRRASDHASGALIRKWSRIQRLPGQLPGGPTRPIIRSRTVHPDHRKVLNPDKRGAP